MRIAAAVATALLLAACGGAGLPPVPGDQVRVIFPAGGVVDEIRIDAIDRLPLRMAELIAPDGSATAADRLQVEASPVTAASQHFGADPYAGSAFGVANLPNAAPPTAAGAAPQSRTALLAIVATAWITLPDLVAYRHDWQGYRIRLRFGDAPGEDTRLLPAPEPPPG